MLHSFFSVPVGPYHPEQRLFRCRGELPSEGLPEITDIPVASFAVRRVVIIVPREYHIFHVEVVLPSIWRATPCERESGDAERRNLASWGLTLLPPDAAAPLIHVTGKIAEMSKLVFGYSFVASHLFYADRRHSPAVAETLRFIERLEELHTEMQGVVSSPHLATTLIFDVLR